MFTITGPSTNEKVFLNLRSLRVLTQQGLTKAFYKIAIDLKKNAKRSILKKPKSGRLYHLKLNGQTVLHRASRRGEPPAEFTGSLRNSIITNIVGSNRLEFGVVEGRSIPNVTFSGQKGVMYAKRLETTMKRRFLLPAIQKNFSKNETLFEMNLKKSISGSK